MQQNKYSHNCASRAVYVRTSAEQSGRHRVSKLKYNRIDDALVEQGYRMARRPALAGRVSGVG